LNVVILGGASYFCRQVLGRIVDALPSNCRYVLADYEYRTVRKMAKKLGERFQGRMVDVTDQVAMGELLDDADIVLSFVGPWYRFGEFVVRSCLDAGVPLVAANPRSTLEPWSERGKGDPPIILGAAFFPAGFKLAAMFLADRGVSLEELKGVVSVDFGSYGGLGGLREFHRFLAVEKGRIRKGDVTPVDVEVLPSGVLQKLARSGIFGRSGIKGEFLSALQEMRRRSVGLPEPGSVTISFVAGENEELRLYWDQVRDISACLMATAARFIIEGKNLGGIEELVSLEEVRVPVFEIIKGCEMSKK